MKVNWKILVICLVIPLAVGGLSALVSGGGMGDYMQLNQPPLSPPGWVFPIVWTILYLLMGYASYRVVTADASREEKRQALLVYGAQLLVNFLWSPIFFGLELRLTAFFVLVILWILVYITMRQFTKIDERAGDLLLPYILWITFAGYLNIGTFLLN